MKGCILTPGREDEGTDLKVWCRVRCGSSKSLLSEAMNVSRKLGDAVFEKARREQKDSWPKELRGSVHVPTLSDSG